MKKYIFASLLILYGYVSNSQILIGYTEAEIRKELKGNVYGVRDGDTLQAMMSIQNGNTWMYIFFGNKTSVECSFFTDMDSVVNALVNKYNKEAVVVSNTEWKYYSGGKILYIYIEYHEASKQYIFSYSDVPAESVHKKIKR